MSEPDTTDLQLTDDNEIIRVSDGKTIAIYRPEAGEDEEAIQYAHWKFKDYAETILRLLEEGPTQEPPSAEDEAPEETTPGPVAETIKGGEFDGFPVQGPEGDLTPGWPEAILKHKGREVFRKKYRNGLRLVRYNKFRAKQGLKPIE